jgi:hypothetical protein
MIYAAAWNATGNNEYYELYRKYINEAVSESFKVEARTTLQMQSCFELLKTIEKDPELSRKMDEIMALVSKLVYSRAIKAEKDASSLDLTMLTSDWRSVTVIKMGSEYRKVWYCVRESGEAALTLLTDPYFVFTEEQRTLLKML